MEALVAGGEKQKGSVYAAAQSIAGQDSLRNLVVNLISTSGALDARLWLDGVYTDISEEQIQGDWMKDREVYFKIEGRVDKRKGSQQ